MDKKLTETLKNNLIVLMTLRDIPSGNALSKQTDVSQRTINNILSDDQLPNPTIGVVNSLAKTLSVEPWMMLSKDFPFSGPSTKLPHISKEALALLTSFENASSETRLSILRQMSFMLQDIDSDNKKSKIIREVANRYKSHI